MRMVTVLCIAMAALVSVSVLGLYGPTMAAAPKGQPPFANSVEQRMEMIRELRGIRELLAEQNELLAEQNELLRGENGDASKN